MDVPTLWTERLVIEPLSPAHSLGMFALWSDEDVCRYSGKIVDAAGEEIESPVKTRADSDRILGYWLQASVSGTGFRWAVVLRESGSFLGTAGFNTLGERCEYAYHLHPSAWGRGLMSEATAAALEWASSYGRCAEVEVFIDRDNDRSIALALRNGFELQSQGTDRTDRYASRVRRLERDT